MTMHHVHTSKPKVFGKGHGTHLAYNYRLARQLIKTAFKLIVNGAIPKIWQENPHFEIVDAYYKLRGFRYGTDNLNRCNECGNNLKMPASCIAKAETTITQLPSKPSVPTDQPIGEFKHPEERLLNQNGINHK